jgi:hypothetical protein
MEQIIKKLGHDIILTFTWFEDKKVWVKYFRSGEEVTDYLSFSYNDRKSIESFIEDFSTSRTDLTMWSY